MHPVETYLREIAAIRASGAAVKETSYYGPLANLLNAVGATLKPKVRCIVHVKNQGAGIPDGGLFTASQMQRADEAALLTTILPERGVIEAKGPGADVGAIAGDAQVAKYLAKYGQVLVTNYREFLLVGRGDDGSAVSLESYRLSLSEKGFWHDAAHPQETVETHGDALIDYLKRAMLSAAPLTTPADVAWFLASYARTALRRVQRSGLPALKALRSELEAALGLEFKGDKGDHFFRSTLVQTLFYGVFSAWVLWSKKHSPQDKTAKFDWRMAQWELHVPMIRVLFEQIATPSKLGPLDLVEVLNWTAGALNRVDRAAFFERFDEGHAVQYFYEPFLQAFDPELRKELGVWYTPPEIVRYMVARVDTVLKEELNLPDGLADPNVFVLDPCCGTGAYLVEVLRHIHAAQEAKGEADALGGQDIKSAAMSRVFGFEILPAPYVVAHLQLGLLLQNLGAPLRDSDAQGKQERVGVYLTNALTGWEPPKEASGQQILLELNEEREAAGHVKRDTPILVILGNPPYNAFAGTSPAEEQGLVEPYKEGLVSKWKIKKFNLDDLYIRFFRLAERRIATSEENRGIVCYISNFSYLRDPSFVVMRQRFMNEFDEMWFDGLNGDSRETGKTTPDGKPDPSVFSTDLNREGIRVGTTIGLMVRKSERNATPNIRFRQFWGVTKRADLLNSLNASDFDKQYEPASPTASNRFSFRPTDVAAHYQDWPKLTDICEAQPYQGLAEDRRKALINMSRQTLHERITLYHDATVTWADLKTQGGLLTETYVDFPADQVRAKLLSSEKFTPDNLRRYAMRPFDVQYAYYSSFRPLWRRHRPEFYRQAWQGNAFIASRFNGSKGNEGVPMCYTSSLCDYHYMTPNVGAIAIRLKKQANIANVSGQQAFDTGDEAATANLSAAARAYLAGLGIGAPDRDAETAGLIWHHALAIGYAPAYLTENADGIRQDWPRIPLPADSERLCESAALGRQIAALLDTETPVPGVTSGTIRPELQTIAVISRVGGGTLDPEKGELALTAGWGYAGQNGVTMPGKGRVIPAASASNDWGASSYDIYLNDLAFWRNVPAAVWEYTIGGYQVMKKWLSYREEPLLGRALTKDEAREVTHIARRIAALLLLSAELDANYHAVKSASTTLASHQDAAGN